MAQATELITKFGFEGTTAPLTSYNKQLGVSIKLIAGMTAGLATATGSVIAFANGANKSLQPIINLSKDTGIAVSRIQELGFVAIATGSSAQDMESALSSITSSISGQNISGISSELSMLGVGIKDSSGKLKSSQDVLFDVFEGFKRKGFSRQEQIAFAESVGIPTSLLSLAGKSKKEVEELFKEARKYALLTDEQIKQAKDYNESIGKLSFGLGSLKNLFAVGLAPELKKMSEAFATFLKENKESIIKGVEIAIKTISFLAKVIKRAVPILLVMGAVFITIKIAALGLSGALAAVFSPVILIVAAIAAFVVIVDDLITGLSGGESLIRDFFIAFTGYDISKIAEDLEIFIDVLKSLGGDVLDEIKEKFNKFFSFITNQIDKLKGLATSVGDFFGEGIDGVKGFAKDTKNFFTGEESIQKNQNFMFKAPTGNSGGNTINQTNNIDIKSTDPIATGKSVSNNMQGNLSNASAQLEIKAPR